MKYYKCFLFVALSVLLVVLVGCTSSTKELVGEEEVTDITEVKQNQYEVIQGKMFYVLGNEYIQNNDIDNPGVSELIRDYTSYDGTGENKDIYPSRVIIAIDKVTLSSMVLVATT